MRRLRGGTPSLVLTALAGAGCGNAALPAEDSAWFHDEARARGIDFQWVSGHRERFYFPEIMGGGAALFDLEGDGDLDLYLVQAGRIDEPGDRPPNELHENDGNGRFVDVTAGSGTDDRGYGMGVACGDADGDGRVDLYVTNVGPNALLHNRSEPGGRPRFDVVTETAGVGDPSWSSSAGFVDYDGDGDLDLFCVNYIYWSVADEITCYSKPHPADYCSPKSYDAPARDTLYRNRGDGTFDDVSVEVGLSSTYGNGLGVVFSDFDLDGWHDVFVANDGMKNQLWHNEEGRRLRDVAEVMGCAVDQDGREKAGMGTAAADVDGDGDEDLLVVNLSGEPDSFFRNDGQFFADRTPRVGLAGASRPFTRFGLGLVDFDNDGWFDVYQANGRVTRAPESSGSNPFDEENLLFRGLPDGSFVEVLPRGGVPRPLSATSRAAAFGDVDGDGGIDVVVVNRDAPAYLLMNRAGRRNPWIAFRLREPSGRPALGATLTCRVGGRRLFRRARSTFSYCAANDPTIHIGLGSEHRVADVEVRWADGATERFGGFNGGAVVELVRGTGS